MLGTHPEYNSHIIHSDSQSSSSDHLLYTQDHHYTLRISDQNTSCQNQRKAKRSNPDKQQLKQKLKSIKLKIADAVTTLSHTGLRKIISYLELKVQEKANRVDQKTKPTQIQRQATAMGQSCLLIAAVEPEKEYRVQLMEPPSNQETHHFYNYQRTRTIARVFCGREFGYSALLAELSKNNDSTIILPKNYVQFSTRMVGEAYKLLQHFIYYECGSRTQGFNFAQRKKLTNLLLHCKQQLDYRCCHTFLKFLKIVYSLAAVSFTQQDAVDLYNQLATKVTHTQQHTQKLPYRLLKNHQYHPQKHHLKHPQEESQNPAQKKMNYQQPPEKQQQAQQSNPKSASITNNNQVSKPFDQQQYDQLMGKTEVYVDFLIHFKYSQSLPKLCEYFQSKYPKQAHLFQPQALRTTLCEAIARSLQKLHSIIQKHSGMKLPRLDVISYQSIEEISMHPRTGSICSQLIEIYLSDTHKIRKRRKVLLQIIKSLNRFSTDRKTQQPMPIGQQQG